MCWSDVDFFRSELGSGILLVSVSILCRTVEFPLDFGALPAQERQLLESSTAQMAAQRGA
jgi:hypothetical protein